MAAPRLVVCEHDGHWAAALRRELASMPIGIAELRSMAEINEEQYSGPRLIAVEMTAANIDAVLEWLFAAAAAYPQDQAIVLAARGLEAYEQIVRELGAVHFCTSPRQLGYLAGLVRSFAARHPESVNSKDRIMAELPWGD